MARLDFFWRKQKIPTSLREKMDLAVDRLNAMTGEQYTIVTHLFGRIFVCTIDDVILFTAGTTTRPSTITPIAISNGAPDWVAFPMLDSNDFVNVCKHIGIQDESSWGSWGHTHTF